MRIHGPVTEGHEIQTDHRYPTAAQGIVLRQVHLDRVDRGHAVVATVFPVRVRLDQGTVAGARFEDTDEVPILELRPGPPPKFHRGRIPLQIVVLEHDDSPSEVAQENRPHRDDSVPDGFDKN